ncbi:MAG: NAD(P)H-dependent glycerol-3-phosphate dehydrogenase [Saprospiraceae bacterium]|nr:NAD(P)H-dependent glycerol-3-phosphate dehydrogenase [Saprospiraceae bacterium]MBP7679461.1 NAD(P)H-dependent glycerol-3-phosphate dehydrogenase [Saprospiraceae bacterium]
MENTLIPIGIIGAGSFGSAIANLIAINHRVLLCCRQPEQRDAINKQHINDGIAMSENIIATVSLQEVAEKCQLIFPIVPSAKFRNMIVKLAPHLRPYHILIHGTKGFDLHDFDEAKLGTQPVMRKNIRTMSEVILEESVVVRVGCLSGPNLATEIIAGQPAASVVASRFKEVVDAGKNALNSSQFRVFGSNEIFGAELAGAMKNVIAIGSGILGGLGLGKNIQAMLITRGLTEMIYFGKALGATNKAFLGTAGIGDLVATATSIGSRNYTFGVRLAKGETIDEINASMPELAEGVRTLRIMRYLAKTYKLHVPITMMLYSVVFDGYSIQKALSNLIEYPYDVDVDFL